MKKINFLFLIIIMCILFLAGNVSAEVILPSPYNAGFGPDDGTELFYPGVYESNFEAFDISGIYSVFDVEFGFYFASSPLNKHVIFSPDDQDTTSDESDPQSALVNFAAGYVYDWDDSVTESIFTPSLDEAIGFYINITNTFTNDSLYLYTEEARNDSNIDMVGTFPLLSNPSKYFIGFANPDDTSIYPFLTLEYVQNVNPVPEPATLSLLTLGLAGTAFFRRKKNRL